jgi:Zn-dependent M32 family carboxypeptidase
MILQHSSDFSQNIKNWNQVCEFNKEFISMYRQITSGKYTVDVLFDMFGCDNDVDLKKISR